MRRKARRMLIAGNLGQLNRYVPKVNLRNRPVCLDIKLAREDDGKPILTGLNAGRDLPHCRASRCGDRSNCGKNDISRRTLHEKDLHVWDRITSCGPRKGVVHAGIQCVAWIVRKRNRRSGRASCWAPERCIVRRALVAPPTYPTESAILVGATSSVALAATCSNSKRSNLRTGAVDERGINI